MKRINYFAMSLLASAALAFTGCSSEDLVGGETNKNESGNFYMTLTIDASSASNGTRTAQQEEKDLGTTLESNVNSGTFLIYEGNNLIYTKTMSQKEWDESKQPIGATNQVGKTTLKISVTNVKTDTQYKVYFLANQTAPANPFTAIYAAPDGTDFTDFAGTYDTDNQFVMFNQNDKTTDAHGYTVKFTEANKETPATLEDNKQIKIERVVARIDKPTTETTTIDPTDDDNEVTKANKNAIDSISLVSYALSNLAKQTYLMQHWSPDWVLNIPFVPAAGYYFQTPTEFGDTKENAAPQWFKNVAKNYVFENTASDEAYATKMYFKFKATLKDKSNADFKDGTFYRYEGKIYSSLQTIIDNFETEGQANPFGIGVTKNDLVEELGIDADGNLIDNEAKIKAFRVKYQIEVFERGEMYYNTPVQDQFYTTKNSILRNSIYQLNVKNVYQIGTDVPNGDPDDVKPFYYLNVEVTVNPWVLNKYDVDL